MIIKGIFWDLLDKVLSQGVTFFISIFLARLLTPEEFGIVGMVMVFVGFSQIIIDMGFGGALVQKQGINENHYSSVFYINLFIGSLLTAIFFFSSEYIADFYEQPQIVEVAKAVSFLFLINSLIIVHNAKFTKDLNFKKPAIYRIISVSVSGLVGIVMALYGYGVWSLVAQSLCNAGLYTLLIWIGAEWYPKILFKLKELKELWKFGSTLFTVGLLDTIYTRLDVLLIGKMFSAGILGFYTRSQTLNTLIIQYTSSSLAKVFFPYVSKFQHNIHKIKIVYKISIIGVAFLAFGLLGWFYICAEEIIVLLITDKWLPSVPYFQVMLMSGYAYPLSSIMINVLSGRGKSRAFFHQEIIKKVILSFAFLIGFQFGVMGFLYALVVAYFLCVIVNMYFVGNEIEMTIIQQIKLILPYPIISIFLIIAIHWLNNFLDFGPLLQLIIKGGLFILGYLLLNFIFNTQATLLIKSKIFSKNKELFNSALSSI